MINRRNLILSAFASVMVLNQNSKLYAHESSNKSNTLFHDFDGL